MEILLNGLYDENISPSFYFNIVEKEEEIEKILKKISLKNIFNSIILYKTNKDNIYKPLKSSRRIYSVSNSDTTNELFSISLEQFIRVANTFSLEHYKRGLDFCLKQLSRLGTLRSFNQNETTKNFISPSLSKLQSSLSSLESYQTMIFEKLPIIEYLYELMNGLSKTIQNKTKNKNFLKEALRQYNRRIFIIRKYFKNVEDSIHIENQKNIQYELSEIRKYNEINSEMSANDQLNFQQNIEIKEQAKINKLMYHVTLMAVLFTISSPIISYIIEEKSHHINDLLNNIELSDFIFISIFIFIFFTIGYAAINNKKYKFNLNIPDKLKEIIKKFISELYGIVKPLYVKYNDYAQKNNFLPYITKNLTNANTTNIYSRHIFENSNPNAFLSNNNNDNNDNQRFNQYIDLFSENFNGITKMLIIANSFTIIGNVLE
jgi:hypothetical protein